MFATILRILVAALAALGASNAEELAPAIPWFQEIMTILVAVGALYARRPQDVKKEN